MIFGMGNAHIITGISSHFAHFVNMYRQMEEILSIIRPAVNYTSAMETF